MPEKALFYLLMAGVLSYPLVCLAGRKLKKPLAEILKRIRGKW